MVMLMHLALPTGALLKGIPPNLSAEMLFALAKMGHGDEIVLGDANFPARYYFVQHLIPTYYYCVNHPGMGGKLSRKLTHQPAWWANSSGRQPCVVLPFAHHGLEYGTF